MNIVVGLNLSRKLSSAILSLHSLLLLLHILLVEAWASRDWVVAVVAVVCHCVFEEILFEVVEREQMKVFVIEFESLFVSLVTKCREPDSKIRAVHQYSKMSFLV
jgi:hypothetical protein